jgi:hypothetical protein
LPVRKSLDLVGDGDELELIEDVEKIFAIKFADAELALLMHLSPAFDVGFCWAHFYPPGRVSVPRASEE